MNQIVIFVDNSNIFQGFRKFGIKVDYEKLKKLIVNARKLEAIYLYEGLVYPISPEKQRWYNDLSSKSGYEIKASFDKITSQGVDEKKVDICIAVDIISLGYENAYDTAVLVSGDGDFVPVVKKLKEIGKNVEVWAFRYSLANALKDELEQGNICYLEDILSKIKIN